jgi:hypothetical protein
VGINFEKHLESERRRETKKQKGVNSFILITEFRHLLVETKETDSMTQGLPSKWVVTNTSRNTCFFRNRRFITMIKTVLH